MQQNSATLFIIVTILLLCYQTNFTSASILTPPTSLNTTLNSEAIFTCTVDNALTVYWLVNNNSAGLYGDLDQDLQMQGSGGNTLVATLSVPAVPVYNQSVIACGAVLMGSNGVVKSEPVVLLIQGLLESVSNLTINTIDESTVSVRWTPPHSLANIPINYTLTVTGQLFGYTVSMVTTDTAYYIDLPDHCDNYWLSVMASNAAGHGKNNTLIVNQMEATHIVPDSVEVSLSVPSSSSKPQATITFNVTHNCSVPLTHTIAVQTDSTSNTLSLYGPYHTNSTSEMITVVIDGLTEDKFYYMSLWDQTNTGTVSNPVTVNLSSYDVQNISISVNNAGIICISCYFIPGTQAGGCIMELTAEGNTDDDFLSVHLSRRADEDLATGCIQNLMWGVYSVKVFDAEIGGYKIPGASPALTRVGVGVMPHPVASSTSVTVTRVQSTEYSMVLTTANRGTSVSTSPSSSIDRSKAQQPINVTYRNAAIGVSVVIIVVILVLVALIVIQVRKLKQKRKRLNQGVVAESNSSTTVHFRAQVSSETVTTGVSSTTPSPPIETMSRDEEAPPPPPPPATTAAPLQQQLRITVPAPSSTGTSTVTSTGTDSSEDQRQSEEPSSPGAESSTSFTTLFRPSSSSQRRTGSDRHSNPAGTRPSSYHEPSMNAPGTTDYRRYIVSHGSHGGDRGAPNRTQSSSLRSNTVMTAWAAVNPLTLPVLPEAPPPYDEIERDSTSYQRPQSALIMSTGFDSANSSSVSDTHRESSPPTTPSAVDTTPVEYVSLQFSPSSDSITTTPRDRNSIGSFSSGTVQYAIISNSNTFVSSHSHDRLGSAHHVTNSLV